MPRDDNAFYKIWKFLKEDSWPSFVVTVILAFVFIKFIFFPSLSFITGTSLPLVIVESCSMHHPYETDFNQIFSSSIYGDNGLEIEDTKNWIFQDGFNKGDVIFVVGADKVDVGDVIIFEASASHPLIHRVVRADETYSTKGDNYITNMNQLDSEKTIKKEQVIGKALFRVPIVGWAKLIFFEGGRSNGERGFC